MICILEDFKSELVGGDRDKGTFPSNRCIVVARYDLKLKVKIKSKSILACFMERGLEVYINGRPSGSMH